MKTLTQLSVLFITLFLFACGGTPTADKAEVKSEGEVTNVEAKTVAIDPAASTIGWIGYGPGKQHNGFITVSEGKAKVQGNELVGGLFKIDMNSIEVADLDATTGKADLEGHLKGADFFDVAQFPKATFEIVKVESAAGDTMVVDGTTHKISGNLNMKGITKQLVDLEATVVVDEGRLVAQSMPFLIDRTQWNVMYGSKSVLDQAAWKDKLIKHEVELTVRFEAELK